MTTFQIENIFGEFQERQGVLLDIVTKGFNTKSGGWGAYHMAPDDQPAQFAVIRWKGKRKKSAVAVERIKKMEHPLAYYLDQ